MTTQLRKAVRTMRRWVGIVPASTDFTVMEGLPHNRLLDGWQNSRLPERQWKAFTPILEDLRSGKYREDFVALAEAISSTGLDNPLVIEVGCGSGWNSEVLSRLLPAPIRYIGSDYSLGMVSLGQCHYPAIPFLACDATQLPFPDASCDVLLSGTVLLHLFDYRTAIQESRRVARRFVVFHTVTVHSRRETTVLKKRAYGEWVVEVVFNENHLCDVFNEAGLVVKRVIESIPYDLVKVTGEHSTTKTYLCEVMAR
jgi:ubiquinone/menaquinone biosynthesis C-methylase UbiE